jgi:hypothetical protein
VTLVFFGGNAQNKRGGRVKLQPIEAPPSEFDHAVKGDALYGEFSQFFQLFNFLERLILSKKLLQTTLSNVTVNLVVGTWHRVLN